MVLIATGDLKYDHTPSNDKAETSKLLSQEKYDEELETKSKIIYEQQNIVKDYQDQILKLKEENQLLQQNLETKNNLEQVSEQTVQRNNNKAEMDDMARKIKYYQDDNLRLSNEVIKLSNKLENTKQQLEHFENNKAKLVLQLENLNKIISENNVIDSPFHKTVSKEDDKSETDEKIPSTTEIPKDQYKKIKNSEEIDQMTRDIFKK